MSKVVPLNTEEKPKRDSAVIKLIDTAFALKSSNPFDSGDVVMAPKILVSSSLPYKKPKPEQLSESGNWVRENGEYTLIVQGLEKGIPYGIYPRLFLIWLCDEAYKTESQKISLGGSYREFARRLDIDSSMGSRGSGTLMLRQIECLLESRIAFQRTKGNDKLGAKRTEFLNITEDFDLFWDARSPDQPSIFESEINLSDKFYNEIVQNYVPQDMRAIKAIREMQSPLAMDILLWLTYRLFVIYKQGKPVMVPWKSVMAQFGSGYARNRDFIERAFKPGSKLVLSLYPDAKVEANETGLLLKPSKPLVPEKATFTLIG